MGQSVTIACPPTWDLAVVGKLVETAVCDAAAELSTFDDQVQVIARNRRWTLIVNEVQDAQAAAEEYVANDDLDERFRGDARTLRFFHIRFDDVDVARRSLRVIARAAVGKGESVWVDTDYGWVLHAWDYLRRTARDPLWDWRYARDRS